MNRKSSSASNLVRILGLLVFMAVLAISAFDEPGLQRIVVPLVIVMAVGMSLLRMVFGLASRQSSGESTSMGMTPAVTLVMVVVGVIGLGAASYFMLGQGGGQTPLPEVFRWAPLSGALEAVTQWGGLLILGGLIGVIAVVVLTVFLRRGSELPGNRSERKPVPWDPDNPS